MSALAGLVGFAGGLLFRFLFEAFVVRFYRGVDGGLKQAEGHNVAAQVSNRDVFGANLLGGNGAGNPGFQFNVQDLGDRVKHPDLFKVDNRSFGHPQIPPGSKQRYGTPQQLLSDSANTLTPHTASAQGGGDG